MQHKGLSLRPSRPSTTCPPQCCHLDSARRVRIPVVVVLLLEGPAGVSYFSWSVLALLLPPGLDLVIGPSFSFLCNPSISPSKSPLLFKSVAPSNLVKMFQMCDFSWSQSHNSPFSPIFSHSANTYVLPPGCQALGLKHNPSFSIALGTALLIPSFTEDPPSLLTESSGTVNHWFSCTGPVFPHIHLPCVIVVDLFSKPLPPPPKCVIIVLDCVYTLIKILCIILKGIARCE